MQGRRRLLLAISVAVLSAICTGKSVAYQPGRPIPNEVPRDWSLEEIAKDTPPFGSDGRVYVLVWKVEEDDRPVRVESCLVLKVLDDKRGYYLTHLWRRATAEKPEWRESMTHVTEMTEINGTKRPWGRWLFHSKSFEHRPSNKDIYAALSFKEVNWSFELERGWRYVRCGVCEKSWEEAIGEKPIRFFGR